MTTVSEFHLSLVPAAIAGYHLAPVDRLPYLSIPSLFALLQQKFSCVMHAALLLNGCLVYHS